MTFLLQSKKDNWLKMQQKCEQCYGSGPHKYSISSVHQSLQFCLVL